MDDRPEADLHVAGRGKKLLAVWAWHTDQDRIKYCRACSKREKGASPCPGCRHEQPELWEINETAWELWLTVNTQWRAVMGGIVGLDYSAVFQTAGLLDIELDRCMFSKIQALERFEISRDRKNAEKRTNKKPPIADS